MIGDAFDLFLSWIIRALGVFLIIFAWLSYSGWVTSIGNWSLEFIADSLVWAIGISVVGAFILALGVVFGRGNR